METKFQMAHYSLVLLFAISLISVSCSPAAPTAQPAPATQPSSGGSSSKEDIVLTNISAGFTPGTAEAYRDYFDMVNDQGGINGRKVVVTQDDDQMKTDLSVAAWNRRKTGTPAPLVLMPCSTPFQLSLDKEVNETNPIVTIGCDSVMDSIYTRSPFAPWEFMIASDYTDADAAFLSYLNDLPQIKALGRKAKVAAIHNDVEYQNRIMDKIPTIVNSFPNLEFIGKPITVAFPTPASVTTEVTQVKALNPDIVINTLFPGIGAITSADSMGWDPIWVGTKWFLLGEDEQKTLAPLAAKGVTFIGGSDTAVWTDDIPAYRELKAWLGKAGRNPDKYRDMYYVRVLDNASVIYQALKIAESQGKLTDTKTARTAIKDVLDSTTFDTGGITPPLSLKAQHRFHWIRIYTLDKDGKLKQLSDWIDAEKLLPQSLRAPVAK